MNLTEVAQLLCDRIAASYLQDDLKRLINGCFEGGPRRWPPKHARPATVAAAVVDWAKRTGRLIELAERAAAGDTDHAVEWSDLIWKIKTTVPPRPGFVVCKDDLQFGRWGGRAEWAGRRLTAELDEVRRDFFYFNARVSSTDGSPLRGPVVFHLHDTYQKSVITIRRIRQGSQAELEEVSAWETFTIAAQVKDAGDNWTGLEFDLETLPEIPKRFKPARPRGHRRPMFEPHQVVQAIPQQAGGPLAPNPIPTDEPGFQARIRDWLPMRNVGLWREKLAEMEPRVCRVKLNGRAAGTGFLVGSDIVMTNFHVLEAVLPPRNSDTSRPVDVVCQFDYKVLLDGTRHDGFEVRVAESHWYIDHSPYCPDENRSPPGPALPTTDQLDYVLVRLSRTVGAEPLVPLAINPVARKRGWVKIPDKTAPFPSRMPLCILQHPDGGPLMLALDTDAIDSSRGLWVNSNQTRVRYATNTEPGSSGSPCFDFDWTLVALHHYGDPAWNSPQYNQGIPIGTIRDRLKRAGTKCELGGGPP